MTQAQAHVHGLCFVHSVIRGDGEPVLTGFRTTNVVAVVNYGHVKQHFAKYQAEHCLSSEVQSRSEEPAPNASSVDRAPSEEPWW